MTPAEAGAAWCAAAVAAGVRVVASLPDSWLAPVLDAVAAEPRLRHVRVAREEDAFGLAAGVALTGSRALVLCQNAGLLLSANALGGLAHHHRIPVVAVAVDRGQLDDGFYYQAYKGAVTRPVLEALGVPAHPVDAPEAAATALPAAFGQAALHRRPVVLLASRRALTGDPT
ncbi:MULTISPECIES: thiamine pyrophosphate-binding protein [unclassified Blastococcus]